uniref:START domain-containing protein n=1 Tax=Globisporangium ultimum (strain ATCC 200006 / CBS 805.95 / DAOM BR144) TaxID=431595 RepID=K3X399_GLOUD
MLSGFTNSRVTSPLEAYIHLTTDWQQRRDVLLAMRNRKIDVARLFLHERTRFIDPFQECSELSRFITPEGDFCTIKMDVVPFEGVKSVRQVFDAMHFYLTNLEIAMTEMSGNVTVLENDENTEATVLHYRLATAERGDILVENSCVIFLDTSGLDCDNANHQNVVITADFVDRDDLFPYRPIQRLRKESTSVMKLSACRRKHVGVVPASGDSKSMEKEDELVVVLTRWFFVRMRRPEMAVPEPVLRNITDNLTVCSDDMIHYIREGLHPSSTIEQSESSLVGPEFGQKL